MTKAIGLYLVWTGIIWSVIFMVGIELDANERIRTLCVLMDEYWKKSYAQKLPGFTDKVIEYYEAWQDGKLSLDEIKDKLWKYGGVRLKAEKVMV